MGPRGPAGPSGKNGEDVSHPPHVSLFGMSLSRLKDRVWTRIQELKASPLTFLGRVWQTRSRW